MAAGEPVTRALLIGINDYEDKPLSGAVNDVKDTANFLKSHLGVSEENITSMIYPADDPVIEKNLPTQANIEKAFQDIESNSNSGDFIYIHFSGHGGRYQNINFRELGQRPSIEKLVTMDEPILDMDFGDALDSLVNCGLNVFVVLDCCYSGGATRSTNSMSRNMRCIPDEYIKDETEVTATRRFKNSTKRDLPSKRDASTKRDASIKSLWFDKASKYNLIAACEPQQRAGETHHDHTNGILTFHLLKAFEDYEVSKRTTTYGLLEITLQGIFDRICELQKILGDEPQRPMHLGNKSRIVFGTGEVSDVAFSLSTSVTSGPLDDNTSVIHLTSGKSSGINIGDCFLIYNPSDTTPVAEVEIESVEDNASTAFLTETINGLLAIVQPGWLARLSRRASTSSINVKLYGPKHAGILQTIEEKVEQTANRLVPLEWKFDSDEKTTSSDFSVYIDEHQVFQVQDKEGHILSPLPEIPADREYGYNAESLVLLLQHLSMFRAIKDLKSQTTLKLPSFDFFLRRHPEDKTAWQFVFENKHTETLYISILSLSPVCGVKQIYPPGNAAAEAVETGTPRLESDCIDIKVPDLLKRPGSAPIMVDTIKLIVTDKPASFSHFTLRPLTDAKGLRHRYRDAEMRAPKVASWVVQDEPIRTAIRE